MLVYVVSHRTSGSTLELDSQAFLPNHDLWEASGPTLLEKPWSAGVRLTQNETRGFLNFKRKKEEKTVWEQRGKWTFVYTIA